MRRSPLFQVFLTVSALACTAAAVLLSPAPAEYAKAQETPRLPVGSHPPALEFPWFPDRVHAFVFRNWGLVEPERLARVLGTDAAAVRETAQRMGLAAFPEEAAAFRERGYITVLRRNWHLLPYEQLLDLLDMSAEELAFRLKEDDFLFHKLGRLKPRAAPLRYEPPDAETRARAERIGAAVAAHFGPLMKRPYDPRFAFAGRLARPESAPHEAGGARGRSAEGECGSRDKDERGPSGSSAGEAGARRKGGARSSFPRDAGRESTARKGGACERGGASTPRWIYSYFGSYGDPLAGGGPDPYPEGLLERLARRGVNGVWLHTVLRRLAPGGPQFPEFGAGSARRLAALRDLVERAARYGIGVYLYVNEPRAMPEEFFRGREELAGVREGDTVALCTSHPAVRRWLADALAHVFREVPGLAGAFTITASENLTNCASHGRKDGCKRCRNRTEAEIIAEVNAAVADGIHRSAPSARVFAWDWGWSGHGEAPETIALLPDAVGLLSVSEWGLPIRRGGIEVRVGEYSLSAVGPGPRARLHWRLARERGLPVAAKVQLSATWELAALPWLPVLDLVAEHCSRLAREKLDGWMLSWTAGGYPSPNLEVAWAYAVDPAADPDQVLDAIAERRYGRDAAPLVREAWRAFSAAFREYPFAGAVVYNAPHELGPANPLYAEKTGYRATMVGIPYDDLDGWRGPYPREVFAAQFAKVAGGWKRGIELLERAIEHVPDGRREEALRDLGLARAAWLHFRSTANQARFVMARDRLRASGIGAAEARRLRDEIRRIAEEEIRLAEEEFALSWSDSRIGFEASNHYFFVPLDCVEKVLSCLHALEALGAQPRPAAPEPSPRKAARKPNIVFILADDLGYGELGCYGQKKIRTPHLDRLASEGMRFTQFYAGSTVCAPSRCVLLTGKHTGHAYIRANDEFPKGVDVWKDRTLEGQRPLLPGTVTLARLLKHAGYRTAAIGKWGLGAADSTGAPWKQGFDLFYGYLCQRQAHNHYPTHLWRNDKKEILEGNTLGNVRGRHYAHDLMIEECLRFVRENRGRPFFLYFASHLPHVALQVPEDSLREYEGAFPETPYDGRRGYLPHPTPRAAYAAMITRLDRDIGRLLALLRELGLEEDTLVFFSSDNGPTWAGGADPEFFESTGGLRGLKGSLYEGGIRVPFIARWPGKIPQGAVSSIPFAFWDVLPTLCEIAGIEPPGDTDGLSFLPALLGRPQSSRHEYLYWEYPAGQGQQAARMGRWKVVRRNIRRKPGAPLELYDLEKDPAESRNVAAEHPDLLEKLKAVLRRAHTPSPIPYWNFPPP